MRPGGNPKRAGRVALRSAVAPRILIVGGLDPSGRAGLLADCWAVQALGGRPLPVASALTTQGAERVRVRACGPIFLRHQIQSVRERGPFHAVKLGMVCDRRSLSALVRVLRFPRLPWVIDPVVRTSTGKRLSHLRAADFLWLAGPSRILTPNALEAQWLVGSRKPIGTWEQAAAAAQHLCAEGFGAVIVKGGHLLEGSTDVVCWSGGLVLLRARRLARTPEHRGTGCRFASALATELARGSTVPEAAAVAKALVERFLRTPP